MRQRRPAMAAGAAAACTLMVLALAACASSASPSPSSLFAGSRRPSASPVGVPAGFPVMEEAVPVPSPGDDAIAAWRLSSVGSAAYTFYTSALPAAGFAIVGRYPADTSALIRFRTPHGTILQVVAQLSGGGTLITLRTDRP